MNDEPNAKRPRKRWKRILKWTASIIVLALILWGFVAYWTSSNDCDQKTANAPANPMKAIVRCDYGLANLKLAEIEKPTPKDDQILVRVRAASVNPYDWHFVEGTPKIMRAMGVGLRKPKDIQLGVDFAGTVEAVGKNVTQYKPGDDVFGGREGAFAQYVCRRAVGSVALKPAGLTFEQAAAINIAGITALQGVRDKGKVQPGQKVLINGASGGVGTFAVQLAKNFGAEVTGVCSTRNVELVQSLGADHVIDYTKEDFTKGDQKYDVVLDNVANHSLSECRRVLTPNGIYVLIGGGGVNEQGFVGALGKALNAAIYSRFVKQKMGMMMADPSTKDLTLLADMMQSGKIKPVIDRTYKSLSEVPDAIRYLEEGHARGKVVITVD
ncbi:MAG TPA: NAD(P)-dependent alcohol dehydrogenase [Candidatus Udaeobacter sp.]|jgi:NADPH:quinone reductase-like Zn-dependent oxidoreductase|nr:NAD(P)-dependent alcohol dehydrogenase [Candidatus Udaeobacter sp.]